MKTLTGHLDRYVPAGWAAAHTRLRDVHGRYSAIVAEYRAAFPDAPHAELMAALDDHAAPQLLALIELRLAAAAGDALAAEALQQTDNPISWYVTRLPTSAPLGTVVGHATVMPRLSVGVKRVSRLAAAMWGQPFAPGEVRATDPLRVDGDGITGAGYPILWHPDGSVFVARCIGWGVIGEPVAVTVSIGEPDTLDSWEAEPLVQPLPYLISQAETTFAGSGEWTGEIDTPWLTQHRQVVALPVSGRRLSAVLRRRTVRGVPGCELTVQFYHRAPADITALPFTAHGLVLTTDTAIDSFKTNWSTASAVRAWQGFTVTPHSRYEGATSAPGTRHASNPERGAILWTAAGRQESEMQRLEYVDAGGAGVAIEGGGTLWSHGYTVDDGRLRAALFDGTSLRQHEWGTRYSYRLVAARDGEEAYFRANSPAVGLPSLADVNRSGMWYGEDRLLPGDHVRVLSNALHGKAPDARWTKIIRREDDNHRRNYDEIAARLIAAVQDHDTSILQRSIDDVRFRADMTIFHGLSDLPRDRQGRVSSSTASDGEHELTHNAPLTAMLTADPTMIEDATLLGKNVIDRMDAGFFDIDRLEQYARNERIVLRRMHLAALHSWWLVATRQATVEEAERVYPWRPIKHILDARTPTLNPATADSERTAVLDRPGWEMSRSLYYSEAGDARDKALPPYLSGYITTEHYGDIWPRLIWAGRWLADADPDHPDVLTLWPLDLSSVSYPATVLAPAASGWPSVNMTRDELAALPTPMIAYMHPYFPGDDLIRGPSTVSPRSLRRVDTAAALQSLLAGTRPAQMIRIDKRDLMDRAAFALQRHAAGIVDEVLPSVTPTFSEHYDAATGQVWSRAQASYRTVPYQFFLHARTPEQKTQYIAIQDAVTYYFFGGTADTRPLHDALLGWRDVIAREYPWRRLQPPSLRLLDLTARLLALRTPDELAAMRQAGRDGEPFALSRLAPTLTDAELADLQAVLSDYPEPPKPWLWRDSFIIAGKLVIPDLPPTAARIQIRQAAYPIKRSLGFNSRSRTYEFNPPEALSEAALVPWPPARSGDVGVYVAWSATAFARELPTNELSTFQPQAGVHYAVMVQ